MITPVTIPLTELRSYLSSRLSRFGVDDGTLTELAREIIAGYGGTIEKQFRVEYLSSKGELEKRLFSGENEFVATKKFHREYPNAIFLKVVEME